MKPYLKKRNRKQKDKIRNCINLAFRKYPGSAFFRSLGGQYKRYGTLSLKQLKALEDATGELLLSQKLRNTLIAGRNTSSDQEWRKESGPISSPIYSKDEELGKLIQSILLLAPDHKAGLYFKLKYDNHELIRQIEKDNLRRFHQALLNNSKKVT